MPGQSHHGEQNTNEELARRIETALGGFRAFLQTMETKIMAALDDLKASLADLATQVAADAAAEQDNQTQTTAALAEIDKLLATVVTPGTSDADVQAAVTQIKALSSTISANAAAAAANAKSIADKLAAVSAPPPAPPAAPAA